MYDGDDTVAMFNICTIVTNRLDEKDDRQTINHVRKRSIAVRSKVQAAAQQRSNNNISCQKQHLPMEWRPMHTTTSDGSMSTPRRDDRNVTA